MSFVYRMGLCLTIAALACGIATQVAMAGEEPTVAQSSVAGATVVGIAQGPDKSLWFTEYGQGGTNVGEVSQAAPSSEVAHFSVTSPEDAHEAEDATSIAAGQGGRMWFLIPNLPVEGNQPATDPGVGEITAGEAPAALKEFSLPHAEAPVLEGIAAGPGETIWYVDARNNTVDWFPEANPAEVTAIKLEAAGVLHHPEAVTEAPNGSMWVEMDGSTEPENEGGLVHIASPTAASPSVTEYVFPSEGESNGYGQLDGQSLRVDCSGDVWASAGTDYGIDELNPTTSKVVFLQPGAGEHPGMPGSLTLAPNQSVWWAEDEVEGGSGSGLIDYLAGQPSPFAFLALSGTPDTIITGSDGNLWVADGGIAKVALTEADKQAPTTCPGGGGEAPPGGGETPSGGGESPKAPVSTTTTTTSTTTVATSTSATTTLESELTSLGNLANHLLGDLSRVTISKLLRANGGVTVEIPTSTGGTWQVLAEALAASAQASAAKKSHAVDVIDYKKAFPAHAGVTRAHIGLTVAGKRLLKRSLSKHRRVKLKLTVTFTPTGHAPLHRTLTLTLKP